MPTSSSLPRRAGARPGVAALAALTAAGTAFFIAPAAAAVPGDHGDIKITMKDTDALPQAGRTKICAFDLEAVNFESVQGISWAIEPQPAKPGAAQLSGRVLLTDGAGRTDDNLALPEGQYKLTWRIDGGMGAGKQKAFKVDCSREAPASAHAPGNVPNDGPNGERNNAPNGAPNAEPDAESDSAANAEANGKPNAASDSAAIAGPDAAANPEANGKPNAEADIERGAEPNAEADSERKGEPNAQSDSAANAEADSKPNAEANAAPNGEPKGGPPAGGGGLAEERDFAPVAGAAAVGLVAVAGAAYFGLRRRRSHGAA
ncbi:hypothetical protein [Streptomyces bluensis]|uniref:CopC domain-containing protein n=1 Tax=Streptomyces bluensis TaxID=33897 RepID=A0ABW6UR97_9ACTN